MKGEFVVYYLRVLLLVVGTEEAEPSIEIPEEDMLLPPLALAVVCIGMASVAFVIICGVSMVS